MAHHKPVHTRNTAVWVRGVSRCGKSQNRTRTRDTCFAITAGLPVPVFNPSVVKSEPATYCLCLLLLILNLKYDLFSLATGIKWCGNLHLFGSSDHLPKHDFLCFLS